MTCWARKAVELCHHEHCMRPVRVTSRRCPLLMSRDRGQLVSTFSQTGTLHRLSVVVDLVMPWLHPDLCETHKPRGRIRVQTLAGPTAAWIALSHSQIMHGMSSVLARPDLSYSESYIICQKDQKWAIRKPWRRVVSSALGPSPAKRFLPVAYQVSVLISSTYSSSNRHGRTSQYVNG